MKQLHTNETGKRISMALAISMVAVSQSMAGLVGLWEFENASDLGEATIGTDVTLSSGAISTTAGAGTATDAGAAQVDVGEYLTVDNLVGANGGGFRANQFTVVMDIKSPSLDAWAALLEFSLGGDGDYFIQNNGNDMLGLAAIGPYLGSPGTIVSGTWYRFVYSVDNSGNRTASIDGTLLGSHNSNLRTDYDRASIGSSFAVFWDNDGDESLMHISNLALYDTALTEVEITALGAAGDPIGAATLPNQLPAVAASPAGPGETLILASESYSFTPSDPDGDTVQVQADLGNGFYSAWTALGVSGVAQTLDLTWTTSGTNSLRARARDSKGGVSDWVDIQEVEVAPQPPAPTALVGLWEFENSGNLGAATIGSELGLTDSITATVGSGGVDTGAASVDVDQYLTVTNSIGANGSGLRSNEYTLLLDFKLPALADWAALMELDNQATGDGDYFYSTTRGLGVSDQGYVDTTPPTSVVNDTWHRLVLIVDQGTVRSTYVDGIFIGEHFAGTIDGRWTLGATFDLFSDNGGGEEALSHVSNVALYSGVLTEEEITALGGVGTKLGVAPDTDEDGMPDDWETANGLDANSKTGVNGADGDLDEDGLSNINEMYAGTAANDPLSVFIITEIGNDTGSGVPLTWSSVPGKQYKIHVSENIILPWTPLMNGGEELIVDAAAGANTTTYLVQMPNGQIGFAYVEVLVD